MAANLTRRMPIKDKSFTGLRRYRAQMVSLMLGADVLGFGASAALVFILNTYLNFFIFDAGDLKYLLMVGVCLIMFMNSRLYPGVGVSPVTEIKLVIQYVSMGFASGLILLTLIRSQWVPSHFALLLMWLVSPLIVLLARWGVRILSANMGLWGEPVVVIGRGRQLAGTINYFMRRRRLGFIPVLAVIDAPDIQSMTCPVPLITFKTLLASGVDRFTNEGIQTALVNAPAISEFFRSDESKALFQLFRRLILVFDLDWIEGAAMQIEDFEGRIGITAEKRVLSRGDALLKRTLDIVLATVAAVILSPVMLVAAVSIKLDSPGSVFYVQERLGKDRRRTRRPGDHWRKIRLYKFRSMDSNAESSLKEYLHAHPEAQSEWKANQKLCNDPRITRVGRFLRKFSIDELPQLWNVIKGDMSLVGPRPMMADQLRLYGNNIEAYCGIRPGLTGLWQVSGRNRTTFDERARLDIYYIRNWSAWLDFYILMRTVWVVLSRDGAY